ncbi:glycosyltransferase family protein [Falsiphaeobacter marinintestinus]|uniref:glycosyltransferase family protein n=1 Tax=Falsiphaeobacter marinintestinus TaxID=1492905 RepID=UPI0011B3DA77|nr:glycosyltransferase [Phaeobacter marinintestinus]
MKVLISVTHLLGTGHLSRALTLARAFAADGHIVKLCSGGMPAPQLDHSGVEIIQLPPLRSDGTNFTTLLDQHGGRVNDALLAERQAVQKATLTSFQPDILITELFPFGRRILSEEFLDVLNAAHAMAHRPIVLSSIRDILAPPSKPAKAERADQIIEQLYDAVLVHSDPQTTRLERSWPVSEMLRDKLRYTGYVAPPAAGVHPDRAGDSEILVSAGGGSVGTRLFQTAVDAARLMPDARWRLLVGGSDAGDRIAALREQAQGTATIIEPARPDFRQMLKHAAASVSMCGYNTALDLLQAGTPSVLIPFDAGNEVEQGLRAESLAALTGFSVLRSAQMTPDALRLAVTQVLEQGPRQDLSLGFDGAEQSVSIACRMVRARS